jgi:hypothetical protein
MIATFLAILIAITSSPWGTQVSAAQKREFIERIKTLPVKGEFLTDEAIDKAGRYLSVLFSLTEKDIEPYDIYPFLALSAGLCARKAHRKYAARHFSEIRHPILKLAWGEGLFGRGPTSQDVVQFLKDALRSEKESKILSEMLGPRYEEFRRRVGAYPNAKQ